MKAGYLKYSNDRYWPIFVKKSGKAVSIGIWELSAKSALEAAQKEIDRLKSERLKKKKHYPQVFVNKNILTTTYIVCVEIESGFYSLDSSGEWVKISEAKKHLCFSTYQEAYQAGLDYLKSFE